MKTWPYQSLLLATTALSSTLSLPTYAQSSSSQADSLILEEIVVTARRREESAQDVAISMTVFNQDQLDKANIVNAGDLATVTPSLQANNRFGGDNTTFAIRGFSQELRTTASVGVYFAEVIAPRGANSQQSGDGAGPGDFFDLANVQVLKGPSGTLFGRNTTGGAVLLTPQKPTDEFEFYVEGSSGNYDMYRQQAVVNLPISDNFKVRLGVDNQTRDGYLNNISGIGPKDFGDVDYTAYRASAVWDITNSLENYTIVRYSDSENNGYPGSVIACNNDQVLGFLLCQPDLDRRAAAGNDDFYDVYNFVPEPISAQKTLQAINTTSWEVNDNLLVKNILAYSTLETKQRSSIYGTDWQFAGASLIFQMVGMADNLATTDQETYVEEIQLQGTNTDKTLTWQAGLYYENSKPRDDYGAQSGAIIACDVATLSSSDPADIRCNNLFGIGSVQRTPGGAEYTNQAVYAQATYNMTETLALTAGLRYTDDKTTGYANETIYHFPTVAPGTFAASDGSISETRTPETSSEEPTWLLGLDYKPTDDTLLYGKYSRGYRQGSVNIGGTVGLDTHGPEKVDTFEVGSKFAFRGSLPATLNVAAFYNDFQDQQIQYGYFKTTGVGTTAIVNAGSSTIWGVEMDGRVQLGEQFVLSASYAYLNTNVDKLDLPDFPASAVASQPSTTTAEGEPLSYAPENKLVLTADWLVPVSSDLGDMDLSVSYIFTDEMQAASEETSVLATLPSYELVNINFAWNSIFGSSFDVSAFVNNATDEEYVTFLTGNWNNGFEIGQLGQPRMYGAKVRYNFGAN
ncbi:TonB-dependent receptor [Halioxenophilus sp. WMMB6]|uniref:TonB-dependent receptor n=1 Tax=Halioxenophilus sp. WMMB6 TaxID=3073815 RepID=UPI00295EA9D7|nr:TonB-dependent receptor [Halioxenophilus sp. WMMB6]